MLVRCTVQVDRPEVALAAMALNVSEGGTVEDVDGSMATNQPANGIHTSTLAAQHRTRFNDRHVGDKQQRP